MSVQRGVSEGVTGMPLLPVRTVVWTAPVMALTVKVRVTAAVTWVLILVVMTVVCSVPATLPVTVTETQAEQARWPAA